MHEKQTEKQLQFSVKINVILREPRRSVSVGGRSRRIHKSSPLSRPLLAGVLKIAGLLFF